MTKVCFLGNSHLAVLKLGWPQIEADFPHMALDYYASAGDSFDLVVSGNHIEPANEAVRTRLAYSSGKSGDIEPDYDAYVVCGLLLSSVRAMRAYREKSVEARSNGLAQADINEAGIDAIYDAMRPLLFADVLAKLRQITAAPIFLIGTPLPALERHPNLEKLGEKACSNFRTAYETASERIAKEFNAQFLRQPEETVGPIKLTTRSEFYLLGAEYVRKDKAVHAHMNVAYGAIVLRDALEHILALRSEGGDAILD
jgi:hypothetical protein